MLLDTHHHFDFLTPGSRAPFLQTLAEQQVRIVAQTLTPTSFVELVRDCGSPADRVPLPLWSTGFHPWHITSDDQAAAELELFARTLEQTRFVGEIGLDLSPRRVENAPATRQRRVLREVLEHVRRAAQAMTAEEPYVLSIHAVRSAGEVVDILAELEVTHHNILPVFHRFSGTSDELTRLVRLGGYISVHPQMLTGRRGRAYATQVPVERLLLETDLPEQTDTTSGTAAAHAVVQSLTHTVVALSDLRGCDMTPVIRHTQDRLYGIG